MAKILRTVPLGDMTAYYLINGLERVTLALLPSDKPCDFTTKKNVNCMHCGSLAHLHLSGYSAGIYSNSLKLSETLDELRYKDLGTQIAALPALLTIERINTLRLPSILSKLGEIEQWDAADIGADPALCGLQGSPTRVLATFEYTSGKRKCRFITPEELPAAIEAGRQKAAERITPAVACQERLDHVCIVSDAPRGYAETISDHITTLPITDAQSLAHSIREQQPNAVLWGSDDLSKMLAAQVSALLGLGLCADCTALDVQDGQLVMIRPALSGSVIAKIVSRTSPAMATVRTTKQSGDLIVAAGFGAKDALDHVRALADALHGELAASRKMVDNALMPYTAQVGLTGKTVSPAVYIAIGVSGAVHHIVGMQQAGTVIAINPDKNAPIFDYADYGIVCALESLFI